MSVILSLEWEGKATVDEKSILDFIFSHERYPELSERFKQALEKEHKEIKPYIYLFLEVEGTDWAPYRPATLEEPEEEGGCFDCKLLDYGMEGDDSIIDSILGVYPMANSKDQEIIKFMFSGKVLIPSFLPEDKEFFENILISSTGDYILNFYDSDLEDIFQDYLTDRDWEEINSYPPEDRDWDEEAWEDKKIDERLENSF